MLKKLIPGVLALAMFASVNAQTDVETKETKEVKEVAAFVSAATVLGFSNEEIKAAFVSALENADATGSVKISLSSLSKNQKIAIGATVSVVTLATAYAGYKYRDGKVPFAKLFKKAVDNNGNDENAE